MMKHKLLEYAEYASWAKKVLEDAGEIGEIPIDLWDARANKVRAVVSGPWPLVTSEPTPEDAPVMLVFQWRIPHPTRVGLTLTTSMAFSQTEVESWPDGLTNEERLLSVYRSRVKEVVPLLRRAYAEKMADDADFMVKQLRGGVVV